ncbi:MAG: hypothetical protein JWQ97_1864 [Phenylobacterium sp.]|nr:hypothetical protein [Phenylobacterium sp.]
MQTRTTRAALAGAALLGVIGGDSAQAATPIGNWSVTVLATAAGRLDTSAILVASDDASLVIACDAGGTNILLSYLDALPIGRDLAVRWRVDTGPWRRERWEEGPDHTTLSPGAPEADAAVLRQLARGRLLDITVGSAGRKSAFDLTGVRQVSALIGTCSPMAPAARPGGAEAARPPPDAR